MSKYGVQKQKGWHAINLFFNTSAGGLNSVISDESYSRPGDYVMFKALKDLTIGTTACPSDIDPCNSWNPTNIFVRTCLLYTSPSPRDSCASRMPSSA